MASKSATDALRQVRAGVRDAAGRTLLTPTVRSHTSQVATMESQLAEAQERALQAESAKVLAERRCGWLTRERDSLRQLVESYDTQEVGAWELGTRQRILTTSAGDIVQAQRLSDLKKKQDKARPTGEAISMEQEATPAHKQRIAVLEGQLKEAQARVGVAVVLVNPQLDVQLAQQPACSFL